MSFIDEIKSIIVKDYQYTYTENGAKVYSSTGSELLDLNYAVSSFRNAEVGEIVGRFARVLAADERLAVKWLFYVGDVRGGLGERRLFKICFWYYSEVRPQSARKLLPIVAEFTRFDNLFVLLNGELKNDVCSLISKQLQADVQAMYEGKNVSLLAKWLPSVQTCNEEKQTYLKIILASLDIKKSEYRKLLSKLRKYMKVVERLMSDGEWSEIDYSAVPSRANLLYRSAFEEHDKARRKAFLDSVSNGKAKINAGVLFPHDVAHKYFQAFDIDSPWVFDCQKMLVNDTFEQLWKALPDYVGNNSSTLCVADGSGSMYSPINFKCSSVTMVEVAFALAIYFSQRCSGEFKDKYITFSKHPQLVDLSGADTLIDKLIIASKYSMAEDTNIEAVFDLVLKAAIKSKGENVPETILILSDMEFNDCVVDEKMIPVQSENPVLFETIAKKYEDAGIAMPRLVFWNICSRTCGVPIRENAKGLAFVSGFSPSVCQMVLSNDLDPLKCLLGILNGDRYQIIDTLLSD